MASAVPQRAPEYGYDLFVSFAPENEAWVRGCLLHKLGLPPGRLITREDFVLGVPLVEEFERAVQSSRFTLVVLSPAYMTNQWSVFGTQLANYARIEEKRPSLLPLILEDCEENLSIKLLEKLDCRQEGRWDSEIDRLRRRLALPEPEPPLPLPCPYPPPEVHVVAWQTKAVALAREKGVYIDQRLLDRLDSEAGDEPALRPFLWRTLAELWKVTQRTRLLTLGAYESLGDDLADQATAAWEALSEEQRPVARRIFLRLVDFSDGASATLRPQKLARLHSYGEAPKVFDDTVACLERQRILIRGGPEQPDQVWVRLIHKSLISRCPTVQGILQEYRQPEQQRRRWEQQVEEWERRRRRGGLLDGSQLSEARAWLATDGAKAVGYSSSLPELVEASRKALQRRTVLLRFLVALLVMVLGSGAWIWWRQSERTKREELAARAVAGANSALQDKNPEQKKTAVLLSLAAVCQVRTSEARRTLLESVAALSQIVVGRRINRLAFDVRGNRLATAGADGVWTWDTRTLERIRHFSLGEGQPARSVAWDPLGRLAVGGEEGTVGIWDAASGAGSPWRQLPDLKTAAMAVAFGPQQGQLLTGCANGQVQHWDIQANPPRLIGAFPSDSAVVERMLLSRDGSRLAVVHRNGRLRIFDTARRSLASDMEPPLANAFASAISFGPQGELRTVITESRRIIIREVPGGDRSGFDSPSPRDLRAVAFRPPLEQEVVTVDPEGNLMVWDWKSSREIHRFQVDPQPRDAAFSPDGKLLAVAGDSGAVTFYHMDDQELEGQARLLIGDARLTEEVCRKYLGGERCHEYSICSF